ncbi:Geraniol 8-hydroxylase [Capsicum annuum]|uniref:Geraniol 8-hydroxylase n=1 Tax=Capsicum annuum TaxID=4072 RepID=A0A1U8FPJ8_CAPAN|nr:geraniol 8-hydroxylase [Capsicum annuum]KAF3662232.1 Geraniol 8-hydroxylase [Capsicum annuum]KAF3673041.1 Geraniol 8-hydroxylase [Capsicum annuum]PHT91559.1 Geraniol 8-hydroxylase [Capsicum annuum]
MDYVGIVVGLLFAWTLVQCIRWLAISKRCNKKLPPGPNPLPLIGNLHNLLGDQPHNSLAKLAEKYGPIISLRLGQITTVVISSSHVAKEVLQKQDMAFSSRSVPDAFHAQNLSKFSVQWLPVANRWRSLRKILNSCIFSVSRLDANQHLRSAKIQDLIAYCHRCSQTGEAVNIRQAAFDTSMNLLSNTFFSKDVVDPYTDSGKQFKDMVSNIMEEASKPNLADYFPILKSIDPQGIRRRTGKHVGELLQHIQGLIDERLDQRTISETTGSTDVLDVLLNISKEDPQEIDRNHIERLFLELFMAGTESTSNTFEWAMVEVMRQPYIVGKAKDELAEVIGRGKAIEEADVARLPYLQCIVKETLRMHPPDPIMFHKVDQDVELCGYVVPKDSQVLVHVRSIARDPAIWEDPLTFKPERFWGSKLDVRGQDFEVIPFGAGRRICPGLPLAARTLTVMLGSLLNSFDWKPEGDIKPEDLDVEEKFGITLARSSPLLAVPLPF